MLTTATKALSFHQKIKPMTDQNFTNHRRYVTGYHYVLSFFLLAGFILAIVNVVKQWQTGEFITSLLIMLIFVCFFFIFWFMRAFPMKAQDRAIRAEEGLRYFILTRQPLSRQLTIGQIAALRFAPDEEVVQLIEKTLTENLNPNDIKKAIQKWKGDYHRA
jgi:hypothetical protein